jgi:hypothetical protein
MFLNNNLFRDSKLCYCLLGRAAEFDTRVTSSGSSGTPGVNRPDPPLPAPNLNSAVFVKVKNLGFKFKL